MTVQNRPEYSWALGNIYNILINIVEKCKRKCQKNVNAKEKSELSRTEKKDTDSPFSEKKDTIIIDSRYQEVGTT